MQSIPTLRDEARMRESYDTVSADGTSVFKQKSTVPAKFRVYDGDP